MIILLFVRIVYTTRSTNFLLMTTTKLDLDALVVSGILSESKKNEIIAWNTEARE